MDSREKAARVRALRANMNETAVRIRRYSVDPRLSRQNKDEAMANSLGERIEAVFQEWLETHVRIERLPPDPEPDLIIDLERLHLEIDHKTDLVQRELISADVSRAGLRTIAWLAVAMVVIAVVYVWSHRVPMTEAGVLDFEPWSEWGPLKYAEVMFWGVLGCLAYLILTAATYMMRRDFDPWYQSWYLAVFLRAPFITAMLMLIVLEFVEWYGEDKSWIHDYILEEGNKYYFIAFMSFCLGLSSDRASSMMRELSNGVSGLVTGAVSKISSKLRSAVGDPGPAPTKH